MKDFEGAPLFVDISSLYPGKRVVVGSDIGGAYVNVIVGDVHTWRYFDEVKPINSDARAFLAIAKRGAK